MMLSRHNPFRSVCLGNAPCQPERELPIQIPRNRGYQGSRSGAAAVELAVLLPFLMFIFLVTVDWARVFYFSVIIDNCARQGALYESDPIAAAQSPYLTVTDAALADASDLQPQPAVSTTNGVDEAGHPYIEVTVSWQFSTITNFPGITPVMNVSRSVRTRVAPVTPN
jgi:Flp pilus assembly protein TadG